MHPTKLIFAVTVIAPLLCAQSTGSIAGVITNSVNGAPIEGVKVAAGCLPQSLPTCKNVFAVTDAAGAYRLPDLSETQYLVSVEKEEGFSSVYGNPVAPAADSKGARFDVKMTPLASISGRVVDPDGKPVAGVSVQYGPMRPVITDDQGNFNFQHLGPSKGPLWANVKPQPPGKDGERMVPTYYPSSINADQATPVDVQGTDLSGYEIRLRTAPARSLRGVLLDPDGMPVAHAQVMLSPASAPSGMIPVLGIYNSFQMERDFTTSDRSETGADGTFEFPAVLEGDWLLRSFRNDDGIENRQGGRMEVRVGRSDIDNLTLHLKKGFTVAVATEVSDSQSPEPPRARVSLMPLDGQLPGYAGADGAPPFRQRVQILPGRYLVTEGFAPPGYYISAAMLDNRNVLGLAVELSGPTEMKLLLRQGVGTLRGSVEKGAGSFVIVMAEPTANARVGRTVRCDPDGNFSISDLAPGNYTVVAFHDMTVLTLPDPLVRIDSAQGKRVKIDAGSIETIKLTAN